MSVSRVKSVLSLVFSGILCLALGVYIVTHGGGRSHSYRYGWVPDHVPAIDAIVSTSEFVLGVFVLFIGITMVAERVRG